METKHITTMLSEHEFDVLSELYFPHTPAEVSKELGWPIAEIVSCMKRLFDQGLIKSSTRQDANQAEAQIFDQNERWVATKMGLLAHTGGS